MSRKLVVFALLPLFALPAFATAGQPAKEPEASGLHLMNNREFAVFLGSLDTAVQQWQTQLKSVDVKSLGLDRQDSEGLGQSYRQCLQSLDNTREEIQGLSEKQTLRLDLLLLVDLNDLARNLDGFDRDLANAVIAEGNGSTRKSLGYVKEVLSIDTAVAVHSAELQNHVFAFAKVIDATLDQAGEAPGEPPTKE